MNTDNSSLTLQLPDKRQLGYALYGSLTGRPVLYFHGLPGSRLECRLLDASAKSLALRIIAVDRPGFGLSEHQPTRRLLDWPDDINILAKALDIEHFGVIAVSGGAPWALACAYRLPQQVASLAIVGGLGPLQEAALRAGLRSVARLAFRLVDISPSASAQLIGRPLYRLRARSRWVIRLLAQVNGDPDKTILKQQDVADALSESFSEAFRRGPEGFIQEMHADRAAWGFDLSAIDCHVQLWHGDADQVIGPSHSEYLQAHLPDAELLIVPRQGHYSLPVLFARQILETMEGKM